MASLGPAGRKPTAGHPEKGSGYQHQREKGMDDLTPQSQQNTCLYKHMTRKSEAGKKGLNVVKSKSNQAHFLEQLSRALATMSRIRVLPRKACPYDPHLADD